MRLAVSSFAEEVKSGFLRLIQESDQWKYPIVIDIKRASASTPNQLPSYAGLFETEEGLKVELNVILGDDPAQVEFQQQLVRCILLEFAYRGSKAPAAGAAYVAPPEWLVEGIAAILRRGEREEEAALFRTLIEVNRLPTLKDFMAERLDRGGTATVTLYQAYATSLVQLLLDLPSGRANLVRFIRSLPEGRGEVLEQLGRHFPQLAGSEQSSEKWWVLGMARLSAADRFRGLSAHDTEKKLGALLSIRVAGKDRESFQTFQLTEYERFIKLPDASASLKELETRLLELETLAHPLYRPILAEYRMIVADLGRRKARGMEERLVKVSRQREETARRIEKIADYLNWVEATQINTLSNSFSGYLKAAEEMEKEKSTRNDAISRYLDSIEPEFE